MEKASRGREKQPRIGSNKRCLSPPSFSLARLLRVWNWTGGKAGRDFFIVQCLGLISAPPVGLEIHVAQCCVFYPSDSSYVHHVMTEKIFLLTIGQGVHCSIVQIFASPFLHHLELSKRQACRATIKRGGAPHVIRERYSDVTGVQVKWHNVEWFAISIRNFKIHSTAEF